MNDAVRQLDMVPHWPTRPKNQMSTKPTRLANKAENKAEQVYLENLVLLQHLARDVERQILTVNNALDEAQVLRDQLVTVVHDEHPSHIQLDVVLLLLGVKQVKRCTPARADASARQQTKTNTTIMIWKDCKSCNRPHHKQPMTIADIQLRDCTDLQHVDTNTARLVVKLEQLNDKALEYGIKMQLSLAQQAQIHCQLQSGGTALTWVQTTRS